MELKINSKIIIFLYVVTIIFWFLFVFFTKYSAVLEGWRFDYLLKPFLVGMTIIPLIGGFAGIKNSLGWGSFKSVLGRAVLSISLGILTWSGGMVIWNYYLFFTTVEVPYPSLADAIFIFSWPLWIYGLFQIAKVIGVRFALRDLSGKRTLFFLSVVAVLLSVYFSFGLARDWSISWDEGILKLFFDLFYPIGDVVILTLILPIYWLSRRFLGGIYRVPILLLLFGFILNYIGDVIFTLTTTTETYFNGHFSDFLYTTSMFILALGVSMLNPHILNKEKKSN